VTKRAGLWPFRCWSGRCHAAAARAPLPGRRRSNRRWPGCSSSRTSASSARLRPPRRLSSSLPRGAVEPGGCGRTAAGARLVRLLQDPEGRVRRRAAQAVGRVGLAEAIPPLARSSPATSTPRCARWPPSRWGSSAIARRSNRCAPRCVTRRRSCRAAADALGLIGDADSAPAIAAMASSHVPALNAAALAADEGTYPLQLPPKRSAGRLRVDALKAAEALLSAVLDQGGSARHVVAGRVCPSRTDHTRVVPALTASSQRRQRLAGLCARGWARARPPCRPRAPAARAGLADDPRVAWPPSARSRRSAQSSRGRAEGAGPGARCGPEPPLEAIAALGLLKDHDALGLVSTPSRPLAGHARGGPPALREIRPRHVRHVLSGLDATRPERQDGDRVAAARAGRGAPCRASRR